MDKFIDELKEQKVISKEDIDNLKIYIDEKYKEDTSSQRAEILSSTIHQILDKNLDGLSEDCKPLIKISILKSTFLQNKPLISLYDIFNSCICEKDLMSKFLYDFLNWINSKVTNKINETDLRNYASSLNSDLSENSYTEDIITTKVSETKTPRKKNIFLINGLNKKKILIFSLLTLATTFYPITKALGFGTSHNSTLAYFTEKKGAYIENLDDALRFSWRDPSKKYSNTHLPEYMHYRKVNETKLKEFLTKRNSLLTKEPYFSSIISTAKEFNLNPLVLFAITGQEQSFVPQNSENASKIANNPFNVYHSWKEYNTNIHDSTRIAARTVINLSKDMPKDNNPFLWIGKNYAEDKDWGKGVETVFNELKEQIN